MSKHREIEDGEEVRDRRRATSKGNLCESCGETSGTRRFVRGQDLGIQCNDCWEVMSEETNQEN